MTRGMGIAVAGALLAASFAQAADTSDFMPPTDQALATIEWAKTICVEKGRYIGWPSVCVLKNGDILAVFSGDRDEHVCPWGKVQLIRSSDGGVTWSAPQTIACTILDDRDAGIVQLPNGEVLVTWFTSVAYRYPWVMKHHPEYRRHDEKLDPEAAERMLGYFATRSKDDGKTWSAPEKLSGIDQTPHGPILLADGSLLQIGRAFCKAKDANGKPYQRTPITVSRSTDNGHTWTYLCREIPDMNGENAKNEMFHEPHVIELAPNELLGMVRYHGPDNCMRQTFSHDGGKTWTPMAKTEMFGLPPHLIALPGGRILNVYGRRHANPGCGVFAAISSDKGKTWDVEHEICLSKSTNGDLGYPASTLLPDGSILTVYYQKIAAEPKACLLATKWRLKASK